MFEPGRGFYIKVMSCNFFADYEVREMLVKNVSSSKGVQHIICIINSKKECKFYKIKFVHFRCLKQTASHLN